MIVRELITILKINVDKSKMAAFESSINRAKTSMASLQELFVTGFAAGAFGEMVKKTAEQVEHMSRAAAMLGTTEQALEPLKYMAEMTGGSFEGVQQAIMMMNRQLGSAELKPNSPAAQTLNAMHISMKALKELSPDRQFVTLAESLSKIEDPALRSRMAFNLFGRGAREILPLVARGKDGIEELSKSFDKFGHLTKEQTESMEKFAETQKKLGFAFGELTKQLTVAVAPVLIAITHAITSLMAAFTKMPGPIKSVIGVMAMLGSTIPLLLVGFGSLRAIFPMIAAGFELIAGAELTAMAPLLPWIAGIAAVSAALFGLYRLASMKPSGGGLDNINRMKKQFGDSSILAVSDNNIYSPTRGRLPFSGGQYSADGAPKKTEQTFNVHFHDRVTPDTSQEILRHLSEIGQQLASQNRIASAAI